MLANWFGFMSAPVAISVFSKENPFHAKLAENRLLNKPGSAKETRHFIVSLEGSDLTYKAGDSLGVFPTNRPGDVAEIIERLMYPLINEGALILEEGIAYRPGDIDVIWTAGYGFPDHRGGPIFMADAIGLPAIVEALQRYGRRRGDAYGYWRVAPLLDRCAREGRRLGAKA